MLSGRQLFPPRATCRRSSFPDLRPRPGGTGRRGHDHLALGEERRVQGPARRPPLSHPRGPRPPWFRRAASSSREKVARRRRMLSEPSQAMSSGAEPRTIRPWGTFSRGEGRSRTVGLVVTIPHDRTYGSCRVASCVIMKSNGVPSRSSPHSGPTRSWRRPGLAVPVRRRAPPLTEQLHRMATTERCAGLVAVASRRSGSGLANP